MGSNAFLEFFAYHGDLVIVTFLDHAMGDSPVVCVVPGWIVAEDEDCIKLRTWWAGGCDDDDANHEHVVIIKSAIRGMEIRSS